MPNVKANGIQVEYDTFGERSSPPLLLIAGTTNQMIIWDEELCNQWAREGFFVIRFDNRDVGLSTKMEEAVVPDVMAAIMAIRRGEKVEVPYTLDHMADDTVGLLDALQLDKGHLCGFSMGGAIAQTIAFRHPSRVRSMTQVAATTGNPQLPRPKPEIAAIWVTPPPEGREACVERGLQIYRMFAGPGFPFDEVWHRNLAGRAYDRSFYPPGTARQALATIAHGNRKPALASITTPTLVIHGSDDPVVPVEGGKDSAEAIPGAELLIIEGMGHDMPHGSAWPRIIELVVAHARKADGQ